MFGSKSGAGLSISTTAANNPQLKITAPSSAPAQSNLFNATGASGGMFSGLGTSTGTSQPQAGGGLFGNSSQPAQTGGGLFGSSLQPTQTSGSLFGNSNQPAQTGGLFGNSQPAQSSSIFGGSQQPTQQGRLLGGGTSQATQTSNLFSNPSSQAGQSGGSSFGTTSSQPAQTNSLFGNTASGASKPSMFGQTMQNSQPAQQIGLFSGPSQTQNVNPQPAQTSVFGGSSTKIDSEHLRPTTKYDQLTDSLQNEISQLDQAVVAQIQMCNEVRDLLPAIEASGANLPNDVTYVTQKLEEVKIGLENDADEILQLREKVVKKDAREAQVCFRNVDRLKMPAQYQGQYQGATGGPTMTGGVYGGVGLSGWWNHPQTLQRSVRGPDGVRSITLPGDEEDDKSGGPADVIDLFDKRTDEMKETLKRNTELLKEIEDFVDSMEIKIVQRERELHDERSGNKAPDDQVRMLRYVFGAVEKSLYDVADKVGGARDGVQELVMGSVDRSVGSRVDW